MNVKQFEQHIRDTIIKDIVAQGRVVYDQPDIDLDDCSVVFGGKYVTWEDAFRDCVARAKLKKTERRAIKNARHVFPYLPNTTPPKEDPTTPNETPAVAVGPLTAIKNRLRETFPENLTGVDFHVNLSERKIRVPVHSKGAYWAMTIADSNWPHDLCKFPEYSQLLQQALKRGKIPPGSCDTFTLEVNRKLWVGENVSGHNGDYYEVARVPATEEDLCEVSLHFGAWV